MLSEQDRDYLHEKLNQMLDEVEKAGLDKFSLAQKDLSPTKIMVYDFIQKTIQVTVKEIRTKMEKIL